MKTNLHAIDDRELATILAGLRLRQRCDLHDYDLMDVATNGGQVQPLTDDEVDELCERLNVEPTARFMYTTLANDPTSVGQFSTLAEMLEANKDDEDFCRFLRRAQPGDSYVAGGGAAPEFTTWRVS